MSSQDVPWPDPQEARADQLRDFLKRLDLHPSRLALFDQALTHSSYAFENGLPGDNERLEFLGDSVIGFFIAEWLYSTSPHAGEGILSKHKAMHVSRSMLGQRAQELGLEDLLLLGKGDLRSGSRRRSSVLGSALEALIGAVYLEMDFQNAKRIVLEQIAMPSREYLETSGVRDYKSALQEFVQKRFHETPVYQIVSEIGPDHEKLFRVEVTIRGKFYGSGEGIRRKTAENQAAREGLERLKQELDVKDKG